MQVDEFERLLRQGRGRAIQHLQQHDATPYRDVLLHACTHDVCFDAQMEGPRGHYLYELIHLTSEPGFYREQLLAALATSEMLEGSRDREALLDLTRCFAHHGDKAARAALYERFACNTAIGSEEGAKEIIELDGLAGFLHVADALGARSLAEPGAWADDHYLTILEEQLGKEAVAAPLTEARRTNPRIEAFLSDSEQARAQRGKARRQQPPLVGLPYAEVRERIVTLQARSPRELLRWGETAPDKELLLAAHDLFLEPALRPPTALLLIFGARPFPLDPQPLLARVLRADALQALMAAQALARLDKPVIRETALQLLERDDRLVAGIMMLVGIFRESDLPLLESVLQRNLSAETLHSLDRHLGKALKNHPSPANVPLLLALYDKTPCSNCREEYVKLLLDLDRLPNAVREECRHDCNFDLRALVGG